MKFVYQFLRPPLFSLAVYVFLVRIFQEFFPASWASLQRDSLDTSQIPDLKLECETLCFARKETQRVLQKVCVCFENVNTISRFRIFSLPFSMREQLYILCKTLVLGIFFLASSFEDKGSVYGVELPCLQMFSEKRVIPT